MLTPCDMCRRAIPLGFLCAREEFDPVTGDRRIVISSWACGLLEGLLLGPLEKPGRVLPRPSVPADR